MSNYVQVPREATDAIIRVLSAPQNKFGKIEADASLTWPIQNLAREYKIGSCETTIEQVAKVLSAIAAAPQATDPRDAEIERLTRERDEALCLAEGPSTLLDLARGSIERGFALHAAESRIATLTAERDALVEAAFREGWRLRDGDPDALDPYVHYVHGQENLDWAKSNARAAFATTPSKTETRDDE